MTEQVHVEALMGKSRRWRVEAERTTPRWRPMCEMLADGYARIAEEWLQNPAANQLRE
jgi:hypothetical protein